MKLFSNPASPFVRKVLIVAAECNLTDQIELQPVALTPVNPNAGVVAQNPLGKIPALVIADGSTLYDSRVICEYLNSHGNGSLYPSADEGWRAQRLQACGDGICDAAILVRYETFVRPEELRWADWIDAQKNKFRRVLVTLENEVDQLDGVFDVGTISIAIALDYLDFRNADEAWRDTCPKLAAWHKSFVQRPSFEKTIPHDLAK